MAGVIRDGFGDVTDGPDEEEEAQPCEWVIFSATQVDPAEYCEDVAEPGERYCAAHLPFAWSD